MHYFRFDGFSFGGLLEYILQHALAKFQPATTCNSQNTSQNTQKTPKTRHFTLKACCTVVERDVQEKRHYTGYGSSDDEWRDDDIVQPRQDPTYLVTPAFNLYQELALKIKMSLQSTRRSNPEVKIVMDFDMLQFDGGIRQAGTLKASNRVKKYKIKTDSDLYEANGIFEMMYALTQQYIYTHAQLGVNRVNGVLCDGESCVQQGKRAPQSTTVSKA